MTLAENELIEIRSTSGIILYADYSDIQNAKHFGTKNKLTITS